MELGTIFGTAFLVGFSGAMMPGPLLTVTIGATIRRGFWAGPQLVLGHAGLEIILVAALFLGLAEFLTLDRVQTVIALVGGTFLVYLGWSMYRDARLGRVNLELAGDAGRDRPDWGLHPVMAGALVSLSNPSWILWWATVGLAYITTSLARGLTGVTVFLSGHLLADLLWYGGVAGAVAGGRRFLSPTIYRGLIVGCGLLLVGLGVYFVYSGLV